MTSARDAARPLGDAPGFFRLGDMVLGQVPVASLRKRRENYRAMGPREMDALRASIERFGWQTLIVVEDYGDGTYGVLDGHHRWAVAVEKGLSLVPVVVVDVDKAGGDLAMLSFNVSGEILPAAYLDLMRDVDKVLGHDVTARLAAVDPAMLENMAASLAAIDDVVGTVDNPIDGPTRDTNKARGTAISLMFPRSPEVEEVLSAVEERFPAANQAESVLRALRAALARTPRAKPPAAPTPPSPPPSPAAAPPAAVAPPAAPSAPPSPLAPASGARKGTRKAEGAAPRGAGKKGKP